MSAHTVFSCAILLQLDGDVIFPRISTQHLSPDDVRMVRLLCSGLPAPQKLLSKTPGSTCYPQYILNSGLRGADGCDLLMLVNSVITAQEKPKGNMRRHF